MLANFFWDFFWGFYLFRGPGADFGGRGWVLKAREWVWGDGEAVLGLSWPT